MMRILLLLLLLLAVCNGAFLYAQQNYLAGKSSYDWFTQAISDSGKMGSQISYGTWHNGYSSVTNVLNGTVIYAQQGFGDANDRYDWFTQRVNSDGSMGPEIKSGTWGNPYNLVCSFVLAGVTYIYGHQSTGGDTNLWFVQQINADGTMGPQTASGRSPYSYSSCSTVPLDGYVYIYLQQGDSDGGAPYEWEIIQIGTAGSFVVVTAFGSWAEPYSSCATVPVGGRYFIYSQQSSTTSSAYQWVIREVLAGGQLSTPTETGYWANPYSSVCSFVSPQGTFIYSQQSPTDANGPFDWFIQEIASGGYVGVQTDFGTWHNGYSSCTIF